MSNHGSAKLGTLPVPIHDTSHRGPREQKPPDSEKAALEELLDLPVEQEARGCPVTQRSGIQLPVTTPNRAESTLESEFFLEISPISTSHLIGHLKSQPCEDQISPLAFKVGKRNMVVSSPLRLEEALLESSAGQSEAAKNNMFGKEPYGQDQTVIPTEGLLDEGISKNFIDEGLCYSQQPDVSKIKEVPREIIQDLADMVDSMEGAERVKAHEAFFADYPTAFLCQCGRVRSRHGVSKNTLQLKCYDCNTTKSFMKAREELIARWNLLSGNRPVAPKAGSKAKRHAPEPSKRVPFTPGAQPQKKAPNMNPTPSNLAAIPTTETQESADIVVPARIKFSAEENNVVVPLGEPNAAQLSGTDNCPGEISKVCPAGEPLLESAEKFGDISTTADVKLDSCLVLPEEPQGAKLDIVEEISGASSDEWLDVVSPGEGLDMAFPIAKDITIPKSKDAMPSSPPSSLDRILDDLLESPALEDIFSEENETKIALTAIESPQVTDDFPGSSKHQALNWERRLQDIESRQEAFFASQNRLEAKVVDLCGLLERALGVSSNSTAEIKERLRLSEAHSANLQQSIRRLEREIKASALPGEAGATKPFVGAPFSKIAVSLPKPAAQPVKAVKFAPLLKAKPIVIQAAKTVNKVPSIVASAKESAKPVQSKPVETSKIASSFPKGHGTSKAVSVPVVSVDAQVVQVGKNSIPKTLPKTLVPKPAVPRLAVRPEIEAPAPNKRFQALSPEELARALSGKKPSAPRHLTSLYCTGLNANKISIVKQILAGNCLVNLRQVPNIDFIGNSIAEFHVYVDYAKKFKELVTGTIPSIAFIDLDPLDPALFKDSEVADRSKEACEKLLSRLQRRINSSPTTAHKRYLSIQMAKAKSRLAQISLENPGMDIDPQTEQDAARSSPSKAATVPENNLQ